MSPKENEEEIVVNDAQTAVQEKLSELLSTSHNGYHKEEFEELNSFLDKYPLPTAVLEEEKIHEQIKLRLASFFAGLEVDFNSTITLAKKLNIPQEIIQECASRALDQMPLKEFWTLHGDYINPFIKQINTFSQNFATLRTKISDLLIEQCTSLLSDIVTLDKSRNIRMFLQLAEDVNQLQPLVGQIDQRVTEIFSKNSPTQNGLIYVKYLGNEILNELLPNTCAMIREHIFANLSSDLNLADYFLESLSNFQDQPWVAENIEKAISHYSVAIKFVNVVNNEEPKWKKQPWVSSLLDKAEKIIDESPSKFKSNDYESDNLGLSDSDPYLNHPWLFTGKQIRYVNALSELMIGKIDEEKMKKLGIDVEKVLPALTEINEKITLAYDNFLKQVQMGHAINRDDEEALLNNQVDQVKMWPLINNVRSFVARYCIQMVEGDVGRLSEIGSFTKDIKKMIVEGFHKYIEVHRVDIPLYDNLYEEFDNLRETGRYPLEVYLGRDGIYAWIGRRAQDAARLSIKHALEGKKREENTGEVVAIRPKYLVYPRFFRDNINDATKRQLLEQEKISQDVDPIFYDTGYTGSIPEQIMQIMGFDPNSIEERIRLLYATYPNRRVRGTPENARDQIVLQIESNAKTEETAVGLIYDEKTGKIRPIAKPTSPREQFLFMMVKQAITRHYWLKEKLYYKAKV